MKKILLSILMLVFCTISSSSQVKTLPSIQLKTMDGNNINIQEISNNDNPIVISFWATWCKPCKEELNNIAEIYEDWQDETNVKLIAISVDDTRTMSKVAPYVNASDWPYEVYLDPNSDLRRAMGVQGIPHTFLLNDKKQIVWQHNSYKAGDEDKLFLEIKKLVK